MTRRDRCDLGPRFRRLTDFRRQNSLRSSLLRKRTALDSVALAKRLRQPLPFSALSVGSGALRPRKEQWVADRQAPRPRAPAARTSAVAIAIPDGPLPLDDTRPPSAAPGASRRTSPGSRPRPAPGAPSGLHEPLQPRTPGEELVVVHPSGKRSRGMRSRSTWRYRRVLLVRLDLHALAGGPPCRSSLS